MDESSEEESEKKIKKKRKKHKKDYSLEESEEEESESEKKSSKKAKKKTPKDEEITEEDEKNKYSLSSDESDDENKKEKKKRKEKEKKKNIKDFSDNEYSSKKKDKKRKKHKKPRNKSDEEDSNDDDTFEETKKKSRNKNSDESESSKEKNRKKKKYKKQEKANFQPSDSDSEENEKQKAKKLRKKKNSFSKDEDEFEKSDIYGDRIPAPLIKKIEKKEKYKDAKKSEESEESSEKNVIILDKSSAYSKFVENNKITNNIIEFLDDNFEEIETSKGYEELKNIIKEFKLKYIPYKNLQRFSIAIIGNCSSGKSTFLNYLLGLKHFLEVKSTITTKCICIIRHKKENKKPKIYSVKVENRTDRKDKFYNFVPNEDLGDDVAKIIADRNKEIGDKKVGNNIEKYFLIIEYDIPFFHGELENYADLFEFMDVPGLNEASENKTTSPGEIKNKNDIIENQEELSENNDDIKKSLDEQNLKNDETKEESEKLTNIYYKEIFPFIKMNIKFCLFIFDANEYGGKDALLVLKTYLEKDKKAYEEIEERLKLINDSNDSENKKKFEKLELKKKLEKLEQSDYISVQTFKDSIFLLNKVDTIPKEEERKNANKNFIEFMTKSFIKDENIGNRIEGFYLTKENETQINAKKLNLKISRMDSFKDYFIFYNEFPGDYEPHSKYFNKYIVKIMNEEFNLDLDDEDETNSEDEEFEIPNEKDLENYINKKCPKWMDKSDFELYINLKKLVGENPNLIEFISPKMFIKLKKAFKHAKRKYKIKDKVQHVDIIIKNKMIKVIDEYLDNHKYLSIEKDVQKDLKIHLCKKKSKLQKALNNMKKNKQGIANPLKAVQKFDSEIKRMLEFDGKSKIINEIKKKSEELKDYLQNTASMKLLLVGPHSSGKSTFLNSLIGYNTNLLPTQDRECTKVCVIIKYSEEKKAKLYKSSFISNEAGYNFFTYNEEDLIAQGEKSIYETLNNINNDGKSKENFLFFLLKTRIEFFDIMGLSKEDKEKIELLDFPGLDTEFLKAQETAKKLLLVIDGFIFLTARVTFAKDDDSILRNIIFDSISERNYFSLETCLFIINKIDINKDFDIEFVKHQILKIFDNCYNGMPLIEVHQQKEDIHSDSLCITGFSSQYYKEYQEFSEAVNDFEGFIIKNKEKNKKSGFFGWMGDKIDKIMNVFVGENEVKNIKENLEEQYMKIKKLKDYKFRDEEINEYFERISKIKFEKIKKEDKYDIIKLYIYLKENKKEYKKYKSSKFGQLIEKNKDIIINVKKFYFEKQVINAIDFLENLYIKFLEYLSINSLKMKNENINIFQDIKKEIIIKDINKEFSDIKERILSQFDNVKTAILNNLNDCDGKKEFEKAVKNNKNNLDALIRYSNRQIANYEYYLRKKSNEINDKLQLNEFQQQKEEFQRNMMKFRQANINNEIKGNSNEYIMKKSFLFFFKIYDNEKTIFEYKNKINQFLGDSEYEYGETLEKNRDKAISKINDLFDTINEKIDNFKGNINDLRDFIQKLELKIYETLGINEE